MKVSKSAGGALRSLFCSETECEARSLCMMCHKFCGDGTFTTYGGRVKEETRWLFEDWQVGSHL
jgi:hypothetical protein